MSKSSSLVLSLTLTALAGVVPASAEVFWIPVPESGGGQKVHLEVSEDGSRRFDVAFVETGHSATGVNDTKVNVDNDEKPDVFNATRYLDGVGMLRITNDPGPNVRAGNLSVSKGSDDYAWPLPIVTNDNWFEKNERAHLHNLTRNAKGHANLEIMNFGTQAAACQVQLLRPKGLPFGNSRTVTLLPLSHEVIEDPFEEFVTTGGGMRAEVWCDQPFYAYGTFLGANRAHFRMHYPLSAPSEPFVETLNVTRNGVFFSPTAGNSWLDVDLPLVPGRAYRKVTVEYDVFINKFTPIFTGLLGMLRSKSAEAPGVLYYGTFVRGARARTLIDLGSAVIEPALRLSSPWKQNATHHVTMVYDAESASVRMLVTQGGKTVLDATGGAYNLDIADRGAPVRLFFGLKGVADNAYYPPLGWKFSNLKVKIEH